MTTSYISAGTIFWMMRDNGRIIQIEIQTNPNKNGLQDYIIYNDGFSLDSGGVTAISSSYSIFKWFLCYIFAIWQILGGSNV